jgi:hypothetical protein
MKSSFVFTCLLVSSSLGVTPVAMAQAQPTAPARPTAPGNPAPQASPQFPYPQTVSDGFVQACVKGTKKQSPKISTDIITNYCRCIITQVQSQVPVGDFVELDLVLRSREPKLNEQQTKTNTAISQSSQFCANQLRTGNR